MKRCRCCRQSWPLEFFTVCRPDGLRRSTCMACRKGCRPGSRNVRNRAYRAHLRASVEAVRRARRYNGPDEYSVLIGYPAQRPVSRLYSERQGACVAEYRRNA